MAATSRFLSRNTRGFVGGSEEGEVEINPLPQQISDPCDPQWQYPNWVCTPYLFGCYVRQLHRRKAIDPTYNIQVYTRWASKMSKLHSWERLCRASCLAVKRAQHSFSTKFLEKVLPEVPENPNHVLSIGLF